MVFVSAKSMFTGAPHSSTMSHMTGLEVWVPSNMMRRHLSPSTSSPSLPLAYSSLFAISVFGFMNMSDTSPTSAIWLWSIMATLSHISSITLISWVITTMVMPRVLFISFSSDSMERVVVGSRAEVASSQSSTFGLGARARAMATLCFCPPDSWAG